MKIQGTLRPLRDNVFVTDMDFGIEKTKSGIFIPSDDGKSSGIHPRWGKVWAVGPDQHDVKKGDWILVEHGRWTRGFEYENDDKSITEFRMVENKSIMIKSKEKPSGIDRRVLNSMDFNIPGAT